MGLQNWCVSSSSRLGFWIHSFYTASSAGLPSPFLFFPHPLFGAISMDERIAQLPRRTANFLKDRPAAAPISEQVVVAVSQQTCCSRKSSELNDRQRRRHFPTIGASLLVLIAAGRQPVEMLFQARDHMNHPDSFDLSYFPGAIPRIGAAQVPRCTLPRRSPGSPLRSGRGACCARVVWILTVG